MASQNDNDPLVDTDEEEGETYTFQQDDSSPSKHLKVSEIEPFATSAPGQEKFYIELCQGGVEIITLETQPQDAEHPVAGFLLPCRQAIMGHSRSVARLNIVTLATFRTSPHDPSPLMNPPKNGATEVYPFQCMVRVVDKSNSQIRKRTLETLAKISNDYNRDHPPRKFQNDLEAWKAFLARQREPKFGIPDDYDRTPSLRNLRKLDHYITPAHVVNIIYKIFQDVDPTWAQRNPKLAEQFFSKPYPDVAIANLGYSNED